MVKDLMVRYEMNERTNRPVEELGTFQWRRQTRRELPFDFWNRQSTHRLLCNESDSVDHRSKSENN